MTSKAFCDDCRTMREVMDEYLTDDGDLYGEGAGQTTTYLARPLECGHSASTTPAPPRPFRPTPGLVERVASLQAARVR